MFSIFFFVLGILTIGFAFLFNIDPTKWTNRNILDREIHLFEQPKKQNELALAEEEINRILNKVYSIDEKLASFKMTVSMFLFFSGVVMVSMGIYLSTKGVF